MIGWFSFNLLLFEGPVEIDTTGHSPQAITSDTRDLSHPLSHTSLSNGDSSLLSTVTTSNGEELPANLSSTRQTNISCLDGHESVLMTNQNGSHLEDNTNQTSLMDHNSLSSTQASSFLSYGQEHQGTPVGIGMKYACNR